MSRRGRSHRSGGFGTLVALLGAVAGLFAVTTKVPAMFGVALVLVVLAVLSGGAWIGRSHRRTRH